MYKTAVTPVREVANTLKQTYLFRSLDGKSLRFLAAQAVEFHYKPNSILFMAGETAPGLFVLASGAVRGVRGANRSFSSKGPRRPSPKFRSLTTASLL
jgi:hypothetical protein